VESLGDKLRSAREGKGYNYDQVSRDTNIATRYLEALEREDFAKFPGEPYLLGFLRNYGEYLGLDVQELLNGYRALKIQEIPIPVEQLLRSPPRTPAIIRTVAIVLVGVAAVVFGILYFVNNANREVVGAPEERKAVEYVMDGPFLERRFYRGDSILVTLGLDSYKLELTNLGEAVNITTPSEVVILDLGQEASTDLNMDGIGDLRITASEFSKNDAAAGALLRFDVDFASASSEGGIALIAGTTAAPPASAANAPVIFTSPNAYPFTLQVAFQGYCMYRWEIIAERDRQGRNEEYFSRGQELNIQAQNGIRMWVSNAAAVKLQVIGGGRTVPLEIGGAGEVVVADLRWVRDDDGRFRLVLLRLE
jgi:cytoskeletal protein RodZ